MKPVVIGIGGGTASGKSTLARAVVQALGADCLHLHHDRYYRSLPVALRSNPLGYNFDHPEALDTGRLIEDLAVLRRGEAATVPVYDFSTHQRSETTERMEPRRFVVLEGILVLHDRRLAALLHHRVFVDAADDIRLIRRIRRDMASRGRTAEDVLAQYERTVRPMHERFVVPSARRADLVLDGTSPVPGLVEAVLARLLAGG
jgi:uridine kinase